MKSVSHIKQRLTDICHKHDIADLYVFGSRSAEISAFLNDETASDLQQTPDVDIGVLPAKREKWDPEKWRVVEAIQANLADQLPHLLDEVRGIADGAEIPLEDLLALNYWIEILQATVGYGCSLVAFADTPEGSGTQAQLTDLNASSPKPSHSHLSSLLYNQYILF